ncbi:MAG: cytochrome c biogenesis protein ResB [Phycisphaerales bacterium]|nr:MAG: cytochrome c biogenesis protein ResB [Phycisphaerales bacterium]
MRNRLFNTSLKILSSSKLALMLVAVVMLFFLAGAVLPQEGRLGPAEIARWQEARPTLTSILKPAGLFHVFYSWPFLISILVLGVNTLTCTALHSFREGYKSFLKGPRRTEKTGFLLLHLSLVLLLAGGFWSAATKLSGFVVLTEGQQFTETHAGYLWIAEGPFRPKRHKGFVASLREVRTDYEQKTYQVDVSSSLDILAGGKKVAEGTIRFNVPFVHQGLSFTQHDVGFSPRLRICDRRTGKLMLDSFVALKTFHGADESEYRDFLPLPFLENRVIITLYPDFSDDNGKLRKTGDEPENPLLLVETEGQPGHVLSRERLPKGGSIDVGRYTLSFTDLRRWASFRIVADPGYPVVLASLWLGVAALLLRYVPDLWRWFDPRGRIVEGAVIQPAAASRLN